MAQLPEHDMGNGRVSDIPDRIHNRLIQTIVKGLSNRPVVLKGGTALMLVYGLDRYSEDIDYDSNTRIDLLNELDSIMQDTRIIYEVVSNTHTETTSRASINYATGRVRNGKFKVEVKNNRALRVEYINKISGFWVYTIDKICEHKLNTTAVRIKSRDFCDLGFIARHFKSELSDANLTRLQLLAKDNNLHKLYREQWREDDFVKIKSFQATVTSLESIERYRHGRNKEDEYDVER